MRTPVGKLHTDRYIPLHPQLKDLIDAWVADLPAYEHFHAHQLANLPSVAAVTSYMTMKTLDPAIPERRVTTVTGPSAPAGG